MSGILNLYWKRIYFVCVCLYEICSLKWIKYEQFISQENYRLMSGKMQFSCWAQEWNLVEWGGEKVRQQRRKKEWRMIAIAEMCVMIIISFEFRKFVAFYEMAAHIIIAICSSCLLKSLHRNSHKRNTNYAFKMLRLMGTSQQSHIVDTQISMGNGILFSQMHKLWKYVCAFGKSPQFYYYARTTPNCVEFKF